MLIKTEKEKTDQEEEVTEDGGRGRSDAVTAQEVLKPPEAGWAKEGFFLGAFEGTLQVP